MPPRKHGSATYLRISELLYLFMLVFSFYLLLISRTGEARTVWEVLHPLFIPLLFATTFILFIALFTSEKAAYKLLFVIAHSILIHSFFSIIFPAGDLSGQQMVLGRTRLVFDNAVLHGWAPWPMEIQSQVYEWFRGMTFQAALSVVFARMLSVDLLRVHLFLVPVLWSTFIPIATFLTTKALGGNEEAAVLSSLLISAFPYATYFGAISVSDSLGFMFFFYSLYFMLKYLDSENSRIKFFMVAFALFSFLSHSLTGIISFSFILLTLAFKSYRSEKSSPLTAKVSLAVSFLLCASLLPMSFIYLRFINPAYSVIFSLNKLFELPIEKAVGLFFLGELINGFDVKTIILILIGPAIALLSMIYLLIFRRNFNAEFRTRILFLFAAFLIVLIDYRILKLFMSGLPLNEERLWVFQDLLAAPFVALAIYGVFSWAQKFFEAHSTPTVSLVTLKKLPKSSVLRVLGLLLALNILLAGWITVSLSAAYPQVAPLQTTWYELEAVKYIEENTHEKYVVIGDQWTIFAGEVIVGVNNPRAYYFLEYNKTGHDFFVNMSEDPSPTWMLLAMNKTNTTIAYFIVTEPRLGTEEFNNVVSKAKAPENKLTTFYVSDNKKLYVFSYRKE